VTSPRILLRTSNLRAKKGLGQNFISDPSMAEMIAARSGVAEDDVVLEIGAGLGALTSPLARRANRIYAVEKDPEIADILKRQLIDGHISNVDVIIGDILKLDIRAISGKENRKLVVLGNLPYNISSQVLVRLIHEREVVNSAVLMFQKEMALRLLARPCSRDYSRLTVMLHYCAEVKPILEIKAACFHPRPKIDSEVLEISFNKNYNASSREERYLFRVIKAAFGRRRKTLKNSLSKSELGIDVNNILKSLDRAGIDPMRRAETLTVPEFIRLSASIRAYDDMF